MAITLKKEDGTGLADSNTYADEAEAETYLENTGRKDEAPWQKSNTEQKRAALLNATAFMDDTYRDRYFGDLPLLTADTQALSWPREGLLLPSGDPRLSTNIPVEIGEACIEYALVSIGDGINPDPTYDPTGRAVKRKKVRVEGAVEKDTTFDGGTVPRTRRKYPTAERVLRQWLRPLGRTILRA